MPWSLKRYYGAGNLHFITSSCYRRLPFLGNPRRRTVFLDLLEETRHRYSFVVVGYVVMPEHVHLLIGEPEKGTPSTVMQVLKQRFANSVLRARRRSPSQALLWEQEAQHIWRAVFMTSTSGVSASGGEAALYA